MTEPRCGRLTLNDVERLIAEGYSTLDIAGQAQLSRKRVQGFLQNHGLGGRQRPRGVAA